MRKRERERERLDGWHSDFSIKNLWEDLRGGVLFWSVNWESAERRERLTEGY